ILIAQAFRFITNPLAAELHCLQAIRNTFAHAKLPISFEHELIGREIQTLQMRGAMLGVESDAAQRMELDNKGWYALTARIAIIIMDRTMKHGGTADEALAASVRT